MWKGSPLHLARKAASQARVTRLEKASPSEKSRERKSGASWGRIRRPKGAHCHNQQILSDNALHILLSSPHCTAAAVPAAAVPAAAAAPAAAVPAAAAVQG